MRWSDCAIVGIACALPVQAAGVPAEPRVGAVTIVSRQFETEQSNNRGSTSSTSDNDVLIERVVAVRADGVEFEYDVPRDGGFGSATDSWQFPARVFRPLRGPLQLTNTTELAARVDEWLKRAGFTRAACGRLIFTWNVFRIECDPKSALTTIEALNLQVADLRDGAAYSDPDAVKPATLKRAKTSPSGTTYVVEAALDPERLRQQAVRRDLAQAELQGKALNERDAVRAHAGDKISGTMVVTLDVDGDGTVVRRTRRLKIQAETPDGTVEVSTSSEVIARQPAAAAPASRDQGPMV
jgi:hypothetical protein